MSPLLEEGEPTVASAGAIPDIERLVSHYLRNNADVMSLDTRFVGKTPPDIDDSWVRVTCLDAAQLEPADHVIEFYVQLDCYAGREGGQPEANLIARNIRAALGGLPGVHPAGVATGVRVDGQSRIPDTVEEPARERVILTVTVWAHS